MSKVDWNLLEDTTLAIYNAHDTINTARLVPRLRDEMAAHKQLDFFEREVWPTLPAVLAMGRRGLPYDSTAKGVYRKRLRAELAEVDAELRLAFTTAMPLETQGQVVGRLIQWLFPTKRTRRRALFTKTEWPKVAKWTPEGMNPNSDHQVRHWLFKTLGLRPSTHTEGDAPSVDQDALQRILQRKPASAAEADRVAAATPILHNLMHRSRLAKIDEDYLDPEVVYERDEPRQPPTADNYLLQLVGGWRVNALSSSEPRGRSDGVVTTGDRSASRNGSRSESNDAPEGRLIPDNFHRIGRVYPTIKMIGTKSGRYAYADPPVHSWPPECRPFVRPREGYCILGADAKAIESRVFTLLTGDPIDGEIFEMNRKEPSNPNWDIHIRTACDMFGWTVDEYTSFEYAMREGARDVAKGFRYGSIQYGGEPETVKTKVKCSCPRCEAKLPPTISLTPRRKKLLAERWFKSHPWAKEWRRGVSETVARTGRYTNPFGQLRFFHAPFTEDTEREAWNWPIQSSATAVLRRGMRLLHAMGAPLILEHHDALYLECKVEHVSYWATAMRQCLERPIPEFGGYVFPTELKAGPSWGELKRLDTH